MSIGTSLAAVILALGPSKGVAADAVTLKDGQTTLGQIVDQAPAGKVLLVVRRDWAGEHLRNWPKRWKAAEAPLVKQGRSQRRQRLEAWKKDRARGPEKDDVITPWIDAELSRLADDPQAKPSRLMLVTLNRSDVRRVKRAPKDAARLLRLGWRTGLKEVESLPIEDLSSALEGRGFSPRGTDPAPIDDLVPVLAEPEARWLARRAATEVVNDKDLGFIRYQGLVLPDVEGGAPPDAMNALGALKGLLDGEEPTDPLPAKLKGVADRGRIGAIVTALEMAPDLATVKVEATLWVRVGPERWVLALARPAVVRPDDLKPDAGAELAADPQVKGAFSLIEGLGLGQIDPELKRRSLRIGAATRQALHAARGGLDEGLAGLAFPVTDLPRADPKPRPAADRPAPANP
ncbi:MAG TPA: hypothetical protein VG406_05775 [Isosphaeraceae bacterium]|jgi:hypothetical protein|nr:hypothetical protein [Isosphaeraceae bacterium]